MCYRYTISQYGIIICRISAFVSISCFAAVVNTKTCPARRRLFLYERPSALRGAAIVPPMQICSRQFCARRRKRSSRSAAAIGRAAVSPAGRGGLLFSASDFRTRDPAASPAACGQADDALFSRVAAFFSRRAAPLPIHAFLQLRRRIYIDKKRLLRYNIRYKTVPWR